MSIAFEEWEIAREEGEVPAQFVAIEPLVQDQYRRILTLCHRKTQDQDTAADLTQDVFNKLFQQISKQSSSGGRSAIRSPKAWLTRVAQNACADWRRERLQRQQGDRPKRFPNEQIHPKFRFTYDHERPQRQTDNDRIKDDEESQLDQGRDPGRNPEESALDREFLMHYLAALLHLTPVQRAAFVLCKDRLLQPEEIERVLGLEPSAAEIHHMMSVRPNLRMVDVGYLFDRPEDTVASDLRRALSALKQELSVWWCRAVVKEPASRWSREFVTGFSGHRGSATSLHFCRLEADLEVKEVPSLLAERDRDFIRAIPRTTRQQGMFWLQREENWNRRKYDLVPGWFKPPEPDDSEYVSLLNRIRDLRRAKKWWTTIARELNTAKVPSRFGPRWHPSGVRLIAERARLAKRRPELVAPKDVLDKIRDLLAGTKKWATIAKELNDANVRVPPRFSQTWQPSAVRLIAQRAGLVRKRLKLIAPKNVLNRIRDLLKAKKKWTSIAKRLNAAKVRVPPGFGRTWRPRGVRLIAQRAGLVRKHRKLIAPTYVLNEIRDQLEAKEKWTTIAKKLNAANLRVPSSFSQTWCGSTVKSIAHEARLVKYHR